MRDQTTFDAWLTHAKETLRLSRAAAKTEDYSAVYPRDAEGQRLWDLCLADGWTQKDGDRALREDSPC